MGQKVHPGGLRVGIIHDWKSNWYSEKDFARYLHEDMRIRDHIYGKLAHAGLSDIHIRKDSQKITIDIYTARPGIVIGKNGTEVDALRREVHDITGRSVQININEIKRPELDARLMAQSVAEQLQNRVAFRRAMKRSLASAVRSGAQGVRVKCGGRLGGTEMSRTEQYSEGRVPLHTLRADIDYGFVEARTGMGRIGVKVWINKGEIMPEGYEGGSGQTTRLGEVDARRRRGGLRGAQLEDAAPARPQRGRRPGGPGGRAAPAVAAIAAAAAAPAAPAVVPDRAARRTRRARRRRPVVASRAATSRPSRAAARRGSPRCRSRRRRRPPARGVSPSADPSSRQVPPPPPWP